MFPLFSRKFSCNLTCAGMLNVVLDNPSVDCRAFEFRPSLVHLYDGPTTMKIIRPPAGRGRGVGDRLVSIQRKSSSLFHPHDDSIVSLGALCAFPSSGLLWSQRKRGAANAGKLHFFTTRDDNGASLHRPAIKF